VNRLLAIAALLATASITSRASGAEASPDKLIEEGLHLRRQGRPAEALELFRQAHAIAPSPRTFGQMGLAEASLREWVEAENHLSVSLSNPDDAWVRKNRAFLDEALSLCRQHVGDLVVSGLAGIEVSIGGRSVGTLPAVPALRLPEGMVTVTASAPGFQPLERTVTIQAGTRTPLAISLVPIVAATTPPAAGKPSKPDAPIAPATPPPAMATPGTATEQPKASNWHTWAGVTVAVVGAGAIGLGALWLAIDGECPHDAAPGACTVNGAGSYKTRTLGWIAAGAGTAVLAGGVVIFLTGRSSAGSNVALQLTPSSLLFATRF
jgi:hypothetical protein